MLTYDSAAIVGHVIGCVHVIFYVSDQVAATAFWQAVLNCPPTLDVPGMTEFTLGTQVVLGAMGTPAQSVPYTVKVNVPSAVGVPPMIVPVATPSCRTVRPLSYLRHVPARLAAGRHGLPDGPLTALGGRAGTGLPDGHGDPDALIAQGDPSPDGPAGPARRCRG